VTLRDLASGKPMDRLVCGDIGYGKTEIALRGTAAAVLTGKQVALVAPTTVLVRQHLQTFRSRFAGFGLRVEALSRLSTPSEARAVRKGLANGDVRIVIGTHAVAGKQVRFHDLGLLVIDEEQLWRQAKGAPACAGFRHSRPDPDCDADGGMGSLYRSQHELILVFKHGRVPHRNNVQLGRFGRNRSDVWHYPGVNSLPETAPRAICWHCTRRLSRSRWSPMRSSTARHAEISCSMRFSAAAPHSSPPSVPAGLLRVGARSGLYRHDHPPLAGADRRNRTSCRQRQQL
jgi:hypothetical protein